MIALLIGAALAGQPLWKDLRSGMTKAEVEALYPTGKTMLTPACETKVIARYSGGTLTAVWLRFGDLMAAGREKWNAATECQKIVQASIAEKYGSPVAHEEKKSRTGLVEGDEYLFVEGDSKVTFFVERGRPFTVVTYGYDVKPTPAKPEAAGNL